MLFEKRIKVVGKEDGMKPAMMRKAEPKPRQVFPQGRTLYSITSEATPKRTKGHC